MNMGILYIVATPIGNLQDITLRAVKILQTVDVIACEDTRKTGILLSRALPSDVQKPRLVSYYEQNELQRIPEIIAAIKDGLNIALVSDAGTPTISDPGFKLVRECTREGIGIVAIPGASSAITALTVSGLPTDKFLFVGYPPHKSGHRKQFLGKIKNSLSVLNSTVIMFEAPHKLLKTLGELKETFGDIDIVICRELTKIYEEVRREKISDALRYFSANPPRGEFIILLHI